jgi:hypothetical protein
VKCQRCLRETPANELQAYGGRCEECYTSRPWAVPGRLRPPSQPATANERGRTPAPEPPQPSQPTQPAKVRGRHYKKRKR